MPNLVKDPHLGQAFNLGKSTDCNIVKNINKFCTAMIYSTTVKNKENDLVRQKEDPVPRQYICRRPDEEGRVQNCLRLTSPENSHEDKRE